MKQEQHKQSEQQQEQRMDDLKESLQNINNDSAVMAG